MALINKNTLALCTARGSLRHPSMLKSPIMKIDRRSFLIASSSALVLAKSQLSRAANTRPSEIAEPLSIEGQEVRVYTTAANSNFRLSQTDTLAFKQMGQPKE